MRKQVKHACQWNGEGDPCSNIARRRVSFKEGPKVFCSFHHRRIRLMVLEILKREKESAVSKGISVDPDVEAYINLYEGKDA